MRASRAEARDRAGGPHTRAQSSARAAAPYQSGPTAEPEQRRPHESGLLEAHSEGNLTCRVADGRGALLLVDGEPGDDRMPVVAALAARYSSHRDEPIVEVVVRRASEETRLSVAPIEDAWARRRLV